MANASTTQASSASETTGTPIPLSYGYVWVTGKRHAYYTIQDTGNSHMDYTRVGLWLLGHGEWDGCSELWLNDILTWTGNVIGTAPSGFAGQTWLTGLDYPNQDFVFNFHSGCDSIIGSGLTPSSSGPDQGCDVLWGQFPSAVQPLCFSRIAYYSLMRKQPLVYQSNDHQNDPSQWTDINPIGLWRALRCRLFDANGNVTGYAFTTNPAWHWVDLWLRRKLFPDYNLGINAGPDALPASTGNRFTKPRSTSMVSWRMAVGASREAIASQRRHRCRPASRRFSFAAGAINKPPRASCPSSAISPVLLSSSFRETMCCRVPLKQTIRRCTLLGIATLGPFAMSWFRPQRPSPASRQLPRQTLSSPQRIRIRSMPPIASRSAARGLSTMEPGVSLRFPR